MARKPRPRSAPRHVPRPDRHVLYEAAVQGPDWDLDFMERVYLRLNGRRFRILREDFCGTGAVAAAWVLRRPVNRSVGVDLDRPTLAWARAHRFARMGPVADRVRLIRGDVRAVTAPPVDVVAALNYSYWVFKRRADLVSYFRTVFRSLRRGGLFFVTIFGGSEAMGELVERKRVKPTQSVLGERVPAFTYIWDQQRFNVVTHEILCHIHFEFRDGSRIPRAFTYDWRLWTMPEVRDALLEVGFRDVLSYIEGWDEERDRPDDVMRLRKRFPNQEGWLGYAVGVK